MNKSGEDDLPSPSTTLSRLFFSHWDILIPARPHMTRDNHCRVIIGGIPTGPLCNSDRLPMAAAKTVAQLPASRSMSPVSKFKSTRIYSNINTKAQ